MLTLDSVARLPAFTPNVSSELIQPMVDGFMRKDELEYF